MYIIDVRNSWNLEREGEFLAFDYVSFKIAVPNLTGKKIS